MAIPVNSLVGTCQRALYTWRMRMKNFMTLYATLITFSTTLADTINSSVAWSGAARFANNTKTNFANDSLYLWLASFAGQVQDNELAPKVPDVLDLVLTKPEKAQLSTAEIERFEKTGMDLDDIKRVNHDNYKRDVKRYELIKRRVDVHEDHIIANLHDAFKAKTLVEYTGDVDDVVSQGLIDKMHIKVNARRGLLFDRIMNDTISTEETVELKKINLFLKKRTQKAA